MAVHNHSLVVRQSYEVLTKHARSFRWASKFLTRESRDYAAVVYAFCRLVDDLADEADDLEQADRNLEEVVSELNGVTEPRPLIASFLLVTQETALDLGSALELIRGVRSDLEEVRIDTVEEFLKYCYRVAGTVGLMMNAVLGVRDPEANAHAIDLGVAMQISNICRDVLEDSKRDRVYLPEALLVEHGLSHTDILEGSADANKLAGVINELLDMAEVYYASADQGLKFIPKGSRFGILIAGRLYRAIGLTLRGRGSNPMMGRVWVSPLRKTLWTVRAAFEFWSPHIQGRRHVAHDATLHHALRGLPGAAV